MSTTIVFSRGFALPKAQLTELTNPLTITNLYEKGGRFHKGDEEGVSFSIHVAKDEQSHTLAEQDGKFIAEHYAKVRSVKIEGSVPVVVMFSLTEQTFPILQGKLGIPRKLEDEGVEIDPIESFDALQANQEDEVVLQASSLTPEQLRQLKIEVGSGNLVKERERVSFAEAISDKIKFEYNFFEPKSNLPEGTNPLLRENGNSIR